VCGILTRPLQSNSLSFINSLERNGKQIEYRTSHRWTIRNGKFIAWEEYPGSEAEFNGAWS
jgi:ketosteroid isomerase-like protein